MLEKLLDLATECGKTRRGMQRLAFRLWVLVTELSSSFFFFFFFLVTLTLEWYENVLPVLKESKTFPLHRKYNSNYILFVYSFYSMYFISLRFIHQEVMCPVSMNYLGYLHVHRLLRQVFPW